MAESERVGLVTAIDGRPVEIEASPGAVTIGVFDAKRGIMIPVSFDCETARKLVERVQTAELIAWGLEHHG